jgi:diacylglycerol kinase (ATP)
LSQTEPDANVATFVIVNPVAGSHAGARAWQRARAGCAAATDWECATSQRPGHARELALEAADRGFERVIAVGGDGTVNEVANGLVHSTTILGIIPAGTGNDVAHNLGVPAEPAAAASLAANGSARPIDLCHVQTGDRAAYFVNVAGFGFDAEVAWRVNRSPFMRFGGGTLPYVFGVLATLWQYRAPGMRLSLDDRALDRRVFLAAVGNLPTYGGGMRIVPDATPDDGMLDVCVVADLSRLEVLRLLPRLYSGGHVGHPAVELFRCRSVSADADGRVLCQADGEIVGRLPARFSVLPAALRCVTGPVAGSTS